MYVYIYIYIYNTYSYCCRGLSYGLARAAAGGPRAAERRRH